MDENRVDTWCCEITDYGTPCEGTEIQVVYWGSAPDESTLMCQGHVNELWQPTWTVRPLSAEEREKYACSWSDWTAPCGAS